MRVNDDFTQGWNVEAESEDPNSVLNFWKRALDVRKRYADLLVSSIARFPHIAC